MKAAAPTYFAVAAVLVSAWADASAQAFTVSKLGPPPIPEASPYVNPDYGSMQARAAMKAAKGRPVPSSVYTDPMGNVFVDGTVKGNLIVIQQPTPRSSK